MGAQVNFDGSMVIKSKKEHFLAHSRNKQKFVNMLSAQLQKTGCRTIHAEGDADVLIAKTAVSSAIQRATTVIGEDTDLLVLLCFHADLHSFPVLLQSDKKQTSKKVHIWDIQWIQRSLGPEICSLLPFVHAVGGCDTTSRMFGIGKGVALRKVKSDPHFRKQAEVFMNTVPREQVLSAGEEAITCLYGGRAGEGLDTLRHRRFCEKVSASTSSVQVHSLPPTSASASYHSARVYFQIHEWIDEQDGLDPEEWGWVRVQDRLEPRMMDLPAAPEDLLKVVRCGCKTDCNSRRCTCKKHGLECSVACGECRGVACSNSPELSLDNITEEL